MTYDQTVPNSSNATPAHSATLDAPNYEAPTLPRFFEITDESLREQIAGCAQRIKLHAAHEDWQAVRVDAQFASDLDAELRRRHNMRRVSSHAKNAFAQMWREGE